MLFNDIYFVLFFIGILSLLYIVPNRFREYILVLASLAFALCQGINCLVCIIFISTISYFGAILIERKHSKYTMASVVMLMALLLLSLKYSGIILPQFISVHSIIIPLGISFYTLRAIAYVVDVYKGEKAEKNFLRHLSFIAFFPLLISGPIEKSGTLRNQLRNPNPICAENIRIGAIYVLYGTFLKMVLAERIAVIVDAVYDNFNNFSGAICLIGIILYSFQIYADFAGYSLMAMGYSRMLGIMVMDNFRMPYLASSVKNFWKRWHISLSEWLRDYVYIPLGGNRKGVVRKNLNLLITFFISGIWHGSGMNFIVWGLLHGIYQIFGNFFHSVFSQKGRKTLNFFGIVITFILVTFAWIFFRAESLSQALALITHVICEFNANTLLDGSILTMGWGRFQLAGIGFACLLMIVVDILREKQILVQVKIDNLKKTFRWSIYYAIVIWIVIAFVQLYGIRAEATFIYANF